MKPRPTILAWWIWFLVVVAVIGGAVLLSKSARADDPVHVYDDGGTVIRLWERPCTGAAKELIDGSALPEAWKARFQAITSTFAMGPRGNLGSKDFAGCWVKLSNDETQGRGERIVMVFEDGDSFIVRPKDFKRHPRKGEQES